MEKLYINDNYIKFYILHFKIVKLLIRKEIHNKITYQHYTSNFISSSITYMTTKLYTTKKEEHLIHD